MLRKLFLLSLTLLMTVVITGSSHAAVCTKRTKLLGVLDGKYAEQRQAIGLISQSGVLEVFASDKGTWTVVVTNPNGMSCIVASGDAYEQVPRVINRPDA